MTTSYVTTAIPFVNAQPHLGFAYELVLADIVARHRRRRGHLTRFVTGTDDNSLKNVAAAHAAGIPVNELVARNAAAFTQLAPLLGISIDDALGTSTDPRHRPTVEALWRACAPDLYRQSYTGWYCAGCEAFTDEGICDEHHTAAERVHETNWFFRLSRYREQIRELIESGRVRILGEAARAETLAFLAGDVRDLSVSRDAARAQAWGIPVPDDPGQVIYVWFDALAYYLSVAAGQWHASDERLHVVGKGITRFHAVYWLAFLLSAGLPLPTTIAVHGYLTVDGKKISKSHNPAPVPPVVERWGLDALRWYFARCCRTRNDADVAQASLGEAYDRDLADRLGNLVQRTITLLGTLDPSLRVPAVGDSAAVRAIAEALPARVDAAIGAFLVDDAAAAIGELLAAANRYLDDTAPWRIARTDRDAALAALYVPLEAARIAAGELAPFVPEVSAVIAARLGDPDLAPRWGGLSAGHVLRAGPPPLPRVSAAAGT